MEYQKRADQPDYKTGKDLAQGVMPQHNPRRAQYACNQNKQAQPHYRIIAEQRTERNQSADNTAHPAMCSLSFHFRLTRMQMIDITRETKMIPVIYQGIFSFRIISRQNTYEMIVSRIGT